MKNIVNKDGKMMSHKQLTPPPPGFITRLVYVMERAGIHLNLSYYIKSLLQKEYSIYGALNSQHCADSATGKQNQ
jgi:hypothetical protein